MHVMTPPLLFDLSETTDWDEAVAKLTENNPEMRDAIYRRWAIARFLSAMHGIVNALPVLEGAPGAAAGGDVRLNVRDALLEVSRLPEPMRGLIQTELDKIHALIVTHNHSLIEWKRVLMTCHLNVSTACTGPYDSLALSVVMHMFDAQDNLATEKRSGTAAMLDSSPENDDDIAPSETVPEHIDDLHTGRQEHPGSVLEILRALVALDEEATAVESEPVDEDPDTASKKPSDEDLATASPSSLFDELTKALPEPIDAMGDTPLSVPVATEISEVPNDRHESVLAPAVLAAASKEQSSHTQTAADIASFQARIRRLHWTIGLVLAVAVAFVVIFSKQAEDAEERARQAKQPVKIEIYDNSSLPTPPVDVHVTHSEHTIFEHQLKLPATIQVGENTVTLERAQ